MRVKLEVCWNNPGKSFGFVGWVDRGRACGVPGARVQIPASRFLMRIVKMSLWKQTPSDFLKQIVGWPVVVKLNSGVDYQGVLACLDGYMNIALEQTEEYVNGQLKNKYRGAFIWGNNVLYISTQKRRMWRHQECSTFHTEVYFLSGFLFLLSYSFSYFVIVGDFSLTHVWDKCVKLWT